MLLALSALITEPKAPPLALEETFATLRPVVRAVIANVLREIQSHPDVEDCTQEVLRRALETESRPLQVRPWNIGVAKHVALDEIRTRQRTRKRIEPISDDSSRELGTSQEHESPERRANDEEQMRAFADALDSLPAQQREALVAFHLDGLSYSEISKKLNVPMGTVATWIARAKTHVAIKLKGGAQ